MKILEIIDGLSSGGAERFVVDLCNEMAKQGQDVTLLCIKELKGNYTFYLGDVSSEVKVESLNQGKYNFFTFLKVYKAIKKSGAEVVHMHLGATLVSILSYCLDRKRKYFTTSHIQADKESDSNVRLMIKKYFFQKAFFKMVAISHQNAASIKQVFKHEPVRLIYNGRAAMAVTDALEDVRKEVDTYKMNDSTCVFTIIARCSTQKNIPRLVRCFNEMHHQGENCILLVIGNGYDNEIGKQAQEDACESIHFLGQKHNIADYLTVSDFFTLSSDYEGMPITLIEALACGCIPVGTPVCGMIDVIKHAENGFLARDFSDEAYIEVLKEAMQKLSSIPSSVLIELYQSEFTMKVCAEKYIDLFKKPNYD